MSKQPMNPELVQALIDAGVELTPVTKKEELTPEQRVEAIKVKLAELAVAKAEENISLQKKLRRQLRCLGFSLSQFKAQLKA